MLGEINKKARFIPMMDYGQSRWTTDFDSISTYSNEVSVGRFFLPPFVLLLFIGLVSVSLSMTNHRSSTPKYFLLNNVN